MKVAKTIKDERKRGSDETRVGAGGIVTRVGKKKRKNREDNQSMGNKSVTYSLLCHYTHFIESNMKV